MLHWKLETKCVHTKWGSSIIINDVRDDWPAEYASQAHCLYRILDSKKNYTNSVRPGKPEALGIKFRKRYTANVFMVQNICSVEFRCYSISH